jgi:hypothetical protein
MLCHLEQTKLYILRVASLPDLLTVGDHPDILDKTMDNLKDLCSGQLCLVLGEPI